jgi:hypothetical protein
MNKFKGRINREIKQAWSSLIPEPGGFNSSLFSVKEKRKQPGFNLKNIAAVILFCSLYTFLLISPTKSYINLSLNDLPSEKLVSHLLVLSLMEEKK